MSLTKEDVEVISNLIAENNVILVERIDAKIEEKLEQKLDAKLQPMRECIKEILKAQIEIVDKVDKLETTMRLVTFHLNLTPSGRGLRKVLHDLD